MDSSLARLLFERALAAIYLAAFLVALNQFVPLLGSRGLESAPAFARQVPFRAAPSLFYLSSSDAAFKAAAWLGVAVSIVALAGAGWLRTWPASAAVWGTLWVLYLSFVNVGQTFYAFGWESLLLEAGFLTIFLGGSGTAPNRLMFWLYRWLLFRVMFGAGLIKIRGDSCWRDLTCLDYYFETQPMPNPLSWYFHWLPPAVHHAGVVVNHVAELVVPFFYFAPQPVAAIAGAITIAFQLTLVVSGNLSWLNWLTIVIAIPTLDDRWLRWLPAAPAVQPDGGVHAAVVYGLTALVGVLSVGPVLNMLSPGQVMNTSFEPLQLVNTYGAFGSITRERNEIVIEGTADAPPTPASVWKAYEFKGKPGDPMRLPPQVAPYHMRLDWLMWFAAFSTPAEHPWFQTLLVRLLQGDPGTLGLLRTNPFPDGPPKTIRARYYRYRFTTPEEHRRTGAWWHREPSGEYFPAVSR
ncbi:MAG TPA: lipase maturation factor family protein [Vicinamibacterales bacterium]|nr:lipase maturation factor family protein [Vicinamibacterales bacterium]